MSNVDAGHPDLRQEICDAVNQVMMKDDFPSEHRMQQPASPDQVTIRCQRTWHDITTLNPRLDGGSFSACIAEFDQDGEIFSFFVEAAQTPERPAWGIAGWSGGRQPPELRDQMGGFMISGGSHVCVGGMGRVPDGGTLRVEMADGTMHESTATDSCAIVFAPVTTPPSPNDHIIVSWYDASGVELGSDRVWIGDGRTPPPRPQ